MPCSATPPPVNQYVCTPRNHASVRLQRRDLILSQPPFGFVCLWLIVHSPPEQICLLAVPKMLRKQNSAEGRIEHFIIERIQPPNRPSE
mmetsp:Transcript_15775/g.44237  ORF Transcript_15775/g.44237 Transcript_15775/m.44237 type:complete len:89 (-) Transcript_15775:261-527(-)